MPQQFSVLFVSRKWPPAAGGMEAYSFHLAEELMARCHLEVRALAGRRNGFPPTPLQLMAFLLVSAYHLARHPRRYEIVHFGDMVLFPLAWLDAVINPARKRILTVHGLDIVFANRKGLLPLAYRTFLKLAAHRAAVVDLYLANSKNTARLATGRGFIPVKPIPLAEKMPSPPPRPRPPAQPPYLLFVGRLVPRKGAAWFAVNVLPLLPEGIRLVVVGTPWDVAELESLKRSSRSDILGYVDGSTLESLRLESLAVIMPNQPSEDETDVEGFGITALEGPRDGVPVLASAIEGIVDAVVDRKTGFLLPHNDPSAWQQKVIEVYHWSAADRATFAATAQATVASMYSWSRVADDTIAGYQQAMAQAE